MFCFFAPLAGKFSLLSLTGGVFLGFALALLWICLIGGLAQNLRRNNYRYGKSSHLLLFGQFGSSRMIVFSIVPNSTS